MFEEDLPAGPELHRQLAGRSGVDSPLGDKDLRPNLSKSRVHESAMKLARTVIKALPEHERPTIDTESLVNMASESLFKLQDVETTGSLPIHDQFVLKAVIASDGSRPVVDFTSSGLDLNNVDLGDWKTDMPGIAAAIAQAGKSVGALRLFDSRGTIVGTAFVVSEGLIMTNKHVLAMRLGKRDNIQPTGWALKTRCKVDFADRPDHTNYNSFEITGVAYVSPDIAAGGGMTQSRDICLLRCDTKEGFPQALPLFSDIETYEKDRDICLIGFPNRPSSWSSATTPPPGYETIEVIDRIFRNQFGLKRLALGEIEEKPGFFPGDSDRKVFTHDASTLQGNSGACVLDFNTCGDRVFGIHFGGKARDRNYAHALASFQQELSSFGLNFLP